MEINCGTNMTHWASRGLDPIISEREKVKCPFCSKRFRMSGTFAKHMEKSHPKESTEAFYYHLKRQMQSYQTKQHAKRLKERLEELERRIKDNSE